MIKYLLFVILLCSNADADPVLLYSANCGATRICVDVNNAGGYNILLYAAPAYKSIQLIVDGTSYSSPTGNSDSITSLPLQSLDGQIIYLTASFVGEKRWTGSGRGRRIATFWTLTDGQIDGLMNAPNPFGAEALPPADETDAGGGCAGSCHDHARQGTYSPDDASTFNRGENGNRGENAAVIGSQPASYSPRYILANEQLTGKAGENAGEPAWPDDVLASWERF